MLRRMILMIIAALSIMVSLGVSHAADEDLWTISNPPDVLIVLDLSGSMIDPPQGGSSSTPNNPTYYIDTLQACTFDGPFYLSSGTGHTKSCTSVGGAAQWSDSTCSPPFYRTSGPGHEVRCRKIDIAKYALFSILNNSNTDALNQVNDADVTSLGVRIGLMKFTGCDSGDFNLAYTNSSSCIKLAWPITQGATTTPTPYANTYCNDASCYTYSTSSSCTASTCTNTCGSLHTVSSSSPTYECAVGFGTGGSTPLRTALGQAKSYLDTHKAADPAKECRTKSVIFITDGDETLTNCSSPQGNDYRRDPVYQAGLLKAAGYSVYVVGFGANMTQDLRRTLHWTAYMGGTRNPDATQSSGTFTKSTNPCNNGSDPANVAIDGYAFMATNPTELADAIRSAITSILSGTYSFSSQAAVAAARIQEENFLYEASFEPRNSSGANKEPFWPGHLKKYSLNTTTGALITPACWDAGAKLATQPSRNMWTYKGAMTAYTAAAVFDADLNVSPLSTSNCGTRCQEIVGFYRGVAAYNIEENDWKLGDLFHTNPVIVKTPSTFFYDPRECGATSFAAFRSYSDYIRTAANGRQLILAGANDGQLHAFRAGTSSTDCTSGGDEVWSFIPPNLLEKMGPIAHNSHADRSTLASHDLFIDGPIQVADAWVPSSASTGGSKVTNDWKTLAIFGLGGGGGSFLWSSSSNCYSPYNPSFPTAVRYSSTYSGTTPYYCGYYALNVTDSVTTSQPTLMWNLNPTSAQAPYLGEPWSKMQIGRVNIAGNEKWVGFVGGGYNSNACLSADGATSYACNTPATYSAGKGFFVVDLYNGNIIWSYTHANNANMDFSAPAAPTAVDADSDGFIDTVYMGDLGGNMWRFRLCPSDGSGCGLITYPSSCTTASWTASLLYQASNVERGSMLATPVNTHKQIFTQPAVTKDPSGYVWVYWGTGENNDPITKPSDTSDTKNRIYAVKENKTFTGTYTTSNLKNITSTVYCYSSDTTGCTVADTENGWYINLSTNTLTLPDGTSYYQSRWGKNDFRSGVVRRNAAISDVSSHAGFSHRLRSGRECICIQA